MSRDLLKALKTGRQKGTLHPQFEENYFFTKDEMYLTSTLGNSIEVGSLSILISDNDRSMFTVLHSNVDSFNAWRQWLSYSSSSALSFWDLEAKKLMQETQNQEKLKKDLMKIFIRKHGISQRQLGSMLNFYSQSFNKVTSNFAYPMRDNLKVENPKIKSGKRKTRFYVQNGKLFLNNSETITLSQGYVSLEHVKLPPFEVPVGAQAHMQVTGKGYQLLSYQSGDLVYQYFTSVKNGEESKNFIDKYIDPENGSVENIRKIEASTDQINKHYQESKSSLLLTLANPEIKDVDPDDPIGAAYTRKIRFIAHSANRLEGSLDVSLLDFSKALRAMETYLSSMDDDMAPDNLLIDNEIMVENETRDIMAPGTQAMIEKYYNLLVKNELDALNEKITENAREQREVPPQQVQENDEVKDDKNTDHTTISDNESPLTAYNLLFEDLHVIATAPSKLQFECNMAESLVELNDKFTNPISDYYIAEAKVLRHQIILDGYNWIKGVNIYNLVLSYLQPNPDDNTIAMIEVMKWLLENNHCSQYKEAIKQKFKEFSIVFYTKIKFEIHLLTTNLDNFLNPDECQRLLTALDNAEDLFEPLFRIRELPEVYNQYKTDLSNARKLLLDSLATRIHLEFKALKERWGSLKHDPSALKEVVLKLQKSVEIYQDARPDKLQTIIWTNQTDALLSFAQAVQAENYLDRENAFTRLTVIRKQSRPFFLKIESSTSAANFLQIIKENRQLLIYLNGNIHINVHDHQLIVWLVRNLTRIPSLQNATATRVGSLTKDAIEIIRVAKSKLVHNSQAMDQAIDKTIILFENFINRNTKKEVLLTKAVVQPPKEVHDDENKENPIRAIHKSKSSTEVVGQTVEDKKDNKHIAKPLNQDPKFEEKFNLESEKSASILLPQSIFTDSKALPNLAINNGNVNNRLVIDPQDEEILGSIRTELQDYEEERGKNENEYDWKGIFSWLPNSFSKAEKREAVSTLSRILSGEKTHFISHRHIRALYYGHLGNICCKAEYRPVIEKYINEAQLSHAREQTFAAIL